VSNTEQQEYWNGEAGQRWAQMDARMARLLQPVAEALISHADLSGCRRAIDVGCGGGSQSQLLAQHLGDGATVLGVDISGPLLGVARERAAAQEGLDFLQADASDHSFEPGSFDLLFSRFGVMFFDDPVAAFTNLHAAMTENARLAFCCWQAPKNNPWVYLSVQAALEHVPPPEPQDPEAPGPFAFADPARLQSLLSAAGFRDIDIAQHVFILRWGEAEDLEGNVRELLQIGPVARLLAEQEEDVRARVLASVIEVLEPHYDGEALNLEGAVWFTTAVA
jgi:SAM-dependent methyltransferase